jgi:hypothetical protein
MIDVIVSDNTKHISLSPDAEVDALDEILEQAQGLVLDSLMERKMCGEATADLAGFVWDLNDPMLPASLREDHDPADLADAKAKNELMMEAGTLFRSEITEIVARKAPEAAKALSVTSREDLFPCVVIAFGRVAIRFIRTNLSNWTAGGSA